jgi:hypothetical protein
VVLVYGGIEVASWPLTGVERPDMAVVDDLARLLLGAKRLGYSVRLRHASEPLRQLLALSGLIRTVPARRDGLVVEVGGEPEGGEQAGVEERVQRRDPIA